jgi:hypothetical protein
MGESSAALLFMFDRLALTVGAKMHEKIRSHFAELQSALEGTTLSDERKQAVARSVAKLPHLYSQFRETNISRFGDEITQLVQLVLSQLEECPTATKLTEEFRRGLHVLHEDLGVPKLPLKPLRSPSKPRKGSKK